MKIKQAHKPRTVEIGPGWRIEYSPEDHEYSAHINEIGVIGYAPTKGEARDLIHDYIRADKGLWDKYGPKDSGS